MNWKPFKSFGEYLELIGTVTGQPIPAALGALIKGGVSGAEFADALTPKYSELENQIKQYIEEKYPEDYKMLEKEIEPVLERINQYYITKFCTESLEERDYVLDEIMVRYRGENRESCREILRWTLEEIHTQIQDVAPTVATMIKLYGKMDSVEEKIDEILEFLRVHFDIERKVPAGESVITDHNTLYSDNFGEPLFMNDEPNATISKVFVKPHLTDGTDIMGMLDGWLTDQYRIHILYGKPGVGKSTFSAFLAALIEDGEKPFADKTDLDLAEKLRGRLHILRLRKTAKQLSHTDAWGSIKACFGVTDDKVYQNQILLLDGLDEVCVLNSDFNGKIFPEQLAGTLREDGVRVKILVTTREGYFNKPESRQIIQHTMEWTEAEMNLWCEKYAAVGENKADYCEKFKADYAKLANDDKRREIFCIPIILYLCCYKKIDITKNHTVVDVYSTVFHDIYEERAYSSPEPTKVQYYISWQFTKELAYQMHLYGTLEKDTAIGSDLVRNAMNRTKAVLREKMPQDKELEKALKDITENDFDQYFQTHFAIMHFQSGDMENGAEFAHKTVGEYFTAVKLYEDYFECVKDPKTTTEQVWRNIFEAFRYMWIPNDILNFFIELTKKGLGEPPEKLFEHYYKGMEEEMPWKVLNTLVVEEYGFAIKDKLLFKQISNVIGMLTDYLTKMDFDNSKASLKMNFVLTSILRHRIGDVGNWYKWKLNKADLSLVCLNGFILSRADLVEADLSGADLRDTHLGFSILSYANLSHADLRDASLRYADLSNANLSHADLRDTNLCDANLIGANLSHADLSNAGLQNTKLSCANFTGSDLCNAKMTKFDYDKLPDYVHEKYTYNTKTSRLELRK